jgi:RNA polymerase sigma-70 factor (ECF subfamily)
MDKNIEILLAGISMNEEASLRKLIERFSTGLYIFAFGIVKRREVAEEIVSDIFFRLWDERKNISRIQNIRSYLATAVRNNSLAYLRSKKNQPHLTLDEIDTFELEPLKCPETILIDKETMDLINKTIAQLPAKNKMAFTLAKINGLKYKEIALLMNISPRTVENHIAKALERIDKILSTENQRELNHLNKLISTLILLFSNFF